MLATGVMLFISGALIFGNIIIGENFISTEFYIFVASAAVFFMSAYWKPMKLKNIGSHFFTLSIKNKQYAEEFSTLNNLESI